MRRFSPLGLALGLSLALAGSCRDALVVPSARIPVQAPARSVTPTVSLDQDINALIDQLFPLRVRPFVHAGWDNVKLRLKRSGPTGEPTRDIKQALGALVAVMQANTARLTTALGETQEHALVRLVLDMELYVFNGPDTPPPVLGPKADLVMATVQPTAKATIQTPSQHAGVEFPAGAVSEPTTVIVAQEAKYYPDNCSGPLNTTRCQYPQFYHFNVFPDKKLNVPAKVAVCHVNSGSTRAPLADHDRFRLAHDRPSDPTAYAPNGTIVDGIEILPFVSMPGLATCGTANTYTASANAQPSKTGFDGLLQQGLNGVARLASAIGNVIAPKELYAIDQGGGGELLFFSTFAVVDPQSAPDIQPAAGFSLDALQTTPGASVGVGAYQIENIGTAAAGPSTAEVVLATDSALSMNAQTLSTASLADVIPASAAAMPAQTVVVPASTPPGNYYLGVRVTDSLPEVSTANNYVSVAIVIAPPARVQEWNVMAAPSVPNLVALWGTSGQNVFAFGDHGGILHFNGSTWTAMKAVNRYQISGAWGTSGSNIITAGDSGTVLHFDGSTWAAMPNPATLELRSVWGASATDIFVAGFGGTIMHFDGASWRIMPSPTIQNLWGIWGSSSSNVFAVGTQGTIVRYDGTTWNPVSSGTSALFRAIWGSSASDIFVVGDLGTILHFDGFKWTPMASGTQVLLRSVWGTSASDVFAVGDNSTILHFDGTAWTPMASPINALMIGVWGNSATNYFIVTGGTTGDVGSILHGTRIYY